MITLKQNSIKLRAFPYPFKAGLAICSDIDECDFETFIRIHRFINSKEYGLGLPVADSFFGVARKINHLAYFNPDGTKRPHEAEFIRQWIKDGLIDSLHSWGDFNNSPPQANFLQDIARNLTNDFIKFDLHIPIWINHGSPNNYQNLFARVHPQYQGDNPYSEMYTMQFIKKLGIKYYWASELERWPLSAVSRNILKKQITRMLLNHIKNTAKLMSFRSDRIKSYSHISYLLNTAKLRDRNKLIKFARFAHHPDKKKIWKADRRTLRYSLSKEVLDELIKDEGYLIVYTHLAKPVVKDKNERLFEPEDETALHVLSEYYNRGEIWVASTSSMLKYNNVNRYLKWTIDILLNSIWINIQGIDDPVDGLRVLHINDLSGICFYSPYPLKTGVKLAGKIIPSIIFEIDVTGGGWIGFNIPEIPKIGNLEC